MGSVLEALGWFIEFLVFTLGVQAIIYISGRIGPSSVLSMLRNKGTEPALDHESKRLT